MLLRELLLLLLLAVAQNKLYQLVSLFRHGARYHINNLYDGNATREVWGELTAVGMRQHETLGNMLRKEYIDKLDFLSANYKPTEIEIYTTDVNRTFQSALSQLYGLYPLGTGPKMPSVDRQYHLPPYSNNTDPDQPTFALPSSHQPIPIAINPQIVMTTCTNYDKQIQRNIYRQLATYQQMNFTYYPFLKRMANIFNIPTTPMNFSITSSLYDTLTVDKYLGRPLPNNFTEQDYTNLRHLHYWFNFFKINYNLSRALNTGKFNRILADFDDRIARPTTKPLKWTLLSAHDTDLSAALLDLNISSAQCIEQLYRLSATTALNCDPAQQYASSLIFELHSDNTRDFYVKIRHDGKYVKLCEADNTQCPYNQWKARITAILVDIDSVCEGHTQNSNARFESSSE